MDEEALADVSCFALPYGTMLGILTFIVVGRPSVKKLFQEGTTALPSEEKVKQISSGRLRR